jgi:hypothetical protein
MDNKLKEVGVEEQHIEVAKKIYEKCKPVGENLGQKISDLIDKAVDTIFK